MAETVYNISLKVYIGGSDFDRNTLDENITKKRGAVRSDHLGLPVSLFYLECPKLSPVPDTITPHDLAFLSMDIRLTIEKDRQTNNRKGPANPQSGTRNKQ